MLVFCRKGEIFMKKIISTLLIAALFIILLCGCSNSRLSIDDYIAESISFRGANGYATVETLKNKVVDIDALVYDLGITSTDISAILGAEYLLEKYISVEYEGGEAPSNLKNGDTVKYVITVDYDNINNGSFSKKLKGKKTINKTYTVDGLEDVIEINPFDAVEKVIVTNYYGSYISKLQFNEKINDYDIETQKYYSLGCNIRVDENIVLYVNFELPNIDSIQAGDKITIKLKENVDTYINNGFLFTKDSQEFAVLTAGDLMSVKDISKASYDKLKALFEEKAQSQSDGEYTFIDMYFYSDEGIYSSYVSNKICALYKFKHDAVGSSDVYIPFTIDNPQIASDGELIWSDITISRSTFQEFNSVSEFEKKYAQDELGIKVTAFEKINF